MATTPNYGWVTPAPTDFVTDLPADFETFADAADATVKALNPGTTAGDIDYYTTGTAKARLGIGTAGQVLTVNSGATAPEWASVPTGSLTLLSTTTLSGASTSITGISGAYKNLAINIYGAIWNTSDSYLTLGFNTLVNNTTYIRTAGSSSIDLEVDDKIKMTQGNENASRTTGNNVYWINLYDYASSAEWKSLDFRSLTDRSGGGSKVPAFGFGGCSTTAAITSVQVSLNGGQVLTAGTINIYGVN